MIRPFRFASKYALAVLTCLPLSMALAACADTFAPVRTGVRLISGPSPIDSAMAAPAVPFVVEVRDSDGGYRSGMLVTVKAIQTAEDLGAASEPAVTVSEAQNGVFTSLALIPIPAGTDGRIQFWVRISPRAGTGQVAIVGYPDTDADTIQFTIVPGRPSKISASPADTVVFTGRTYPLQAAVTDQWGNKRGEQVTWEPGPQLSVPMPGTIRTHEIGRWYTILRHKDIADTAWVSVPPEGSLVGLNDRDYSPGVSIVTFRLDGSEWQRVAALGGYVDGPAPRAAPGGQEFVLHDTDEMNGPGRLFRVSLEGDRQEVMVPLQGVRDPVYAPDGQSIYFVGGYFWEPGIWKVDLNSSSAREVLPPTAFRRRGSPTSSPDGTRIAYWEDHLNQDPQIRVVNVATGVVSSLGLSGSDPKWSPVGDVLAYLESSRVMLYSNNQSRQIVPESDYVSVEWSPDGKWLLLEASDPSLELFRVSDGLRIPLPYKRFVARASWRL